MNLFLVKQSPFAISDLEQQCQLVKADDNIILMYDGCYFVNELDRFASLVNPQQIFAINAHCTERQLTSKGVTLLSLSDFADQCFSANHILTLL